jgi:hypothetical protein
MISFVTAAVAVVLPATVSVFMMNRARQTRLSRGTKGMNRQAWFALASLYLLLAFTISLSLVINGQFEVAFVVLPLVLVGGVFLYIAYSTPSEPRSPTKELSDGLHAEDA